MPANGVDADADAVACVGVAELPVRFLDATAINTPATTAAAMTAPASRIRRFRCMPNRVPEEPEGPGRPGPSPSSLLRVCLAARRRSPEARERVQVTHQRVAPTGAHLVRLGA